MDSDWVLLVPGSRLSLFGLASHPQPIYVSTQPKPLLELKHLPPVSAIQHDRVIVCWDPNWSLQKQRKIAQELVQLGAKRVAFIAAPLLISLTACRRTVLVVQLGYRHTTVSPVIFGQLFSSAMMRSCEPFLELFRLYSRLDYAEINEDDIIELMTIYGSTNMQTDSPGRKRNTGFQSSHLPGCVIELETLQAICNDYARDVADIILQAIFKSPIDCRRDLVNSIVLSGGVAAIQGISTLIIDHVMQRVESDPRKRFAGLKSSFCIVKPAFPVDTLKWIGGCIAAKIGIPENCIADQGKLSDPSFEIEQFQSRNVKKPFVIYNDSRLY